MKKTYNLLFASLVLFLFSCNSGTTTGNTSAVDSTETRAESLSPTATPSFTGTYIDGNSEIIRKLADGGQTEGAGGYLALEQSGPDSLKFELNLFKGAPNYHSGTAEGMLSLKDNVATFFSTEYGDNGCKITFTFNGDEIVVEQVEGSDIECGFGQGVVAFGTYKKDDDKAVFLYEGGF